MRDFQGGDSCSGSFAGNGNNFLGSDRRDGSLGLGDVLAGLDLGDGDSGQCLSRDSGLLDGSGDSLAFNDGSDDLVVDVGNVLQDTVRKKTGQHCSDKPL